ncbi:MAG TPA: sigma-70 family RNA polymerase sigma factor [Kofleriaceae bacterium]|nr:sigma-70 family RNA polymerase sigma factor [Kofleriaceae bacterium]
MEGSGGKSTEPPSLEDGAGLGRAPGAPGSPLPPAPPRPSRINAEREAEVLRCWRQGDKDRALRLLMDTYGHGVLAYARRMVREEDAAKDVRQQTFLEVWRGLDQYEARSSLWTWLCAIVRNRSVDQVKRRARISAREISAEGDVSNAALETPDPSMTANSLSQRDALSHCLDKLPSALREQVLLRCHLGLSYDEIGAIVGEPAGTIQVRIARALPKLRRCLEDQGANDPS